MVTNKEAIKVIEQICTYIDSGKKIDKIFKCNNLDIKLHFCGNPHSFDNLHNNEMAIYIYKYKDKYLKIGKATIKSADRFSYHHYNYKSCNSNLAKSLLNSDILNDMDELWLKEKVIDKLPCMQKNETNLSWWMKNNLERINIILDAELGIFLLNLFEAYLHLKYNPVFEGVESLRVKK